MSQVVANRLWLFKNGATTLDSLATVERGMDTSTITAADLAAPGIEMKCCTGISSNPSVSTEKVYCPNSWGVYVIHDEPTLDSATELVASFSELSLNVMQLFFGTTDLTAGTPAQILGGGLEIQGLAKIMMHDSSSAGTTLAEGFFWTRATLSGINLDRTVSKPQITLKVLPNGDDTPITITNLS